MNQYSIKNHKKINSKPTTMNNQIILKLKHANLNNCQDNQIHKKYNFFNFFFLLFFLKSDYEIGVQNMTLLLLLQDAN